MKTKIQKCDRGRSEWFDVSAYDGFPISRAMRLTKLLKGLDSHDQMNFRIVRDAE